MVQVSAITTRALELIRVRVGSQPVDTDDSDRALAAYNNLMHGIGFDLSLTDAAGTAITIADQTLTDTFPLADHHREGISAILARAIAPDFKRTLSPEAFAAVKTGVERLNADFMPNMEATLDTGVTRSPSRYNWYAW